MINRILFSTLPISLFGIFSNKEKKDKDKSKNTGGFKKVIIEEKESDYDIIWQFKTDVSDGELGFIINLSDKDNFVFPFTIAKLSVDELSNTTNIAVHYPKNFFKYDFQHFEEISFIVVSGADENLSMDNFYKYNIINQYECKIKDGLKKHNNNEKTLFLNDIHDTILKERTNSGDFGDLILRECSDTITIIGKLNLKEPVSHLGIIAYVAEKIEDNSFTDLEGLVIIDYPDIDSIGEKSFAVDYPKSRDKPVIVLYAISDYDNNFRGDNVNDYDIIGNGLFYK